jgi:hypothetical protein
VDGPRRIIGSIGFVLVLLVSLIATTRPSLAAPISWRCSFGGKDAYQAQLYFVSVPGTGNDSWRIQGSGRCAKVTALCSGPFIRDVCDPEFGESEPALLFGAASEGPMKNVLTFGRCDADPTPFWLGPPQFPPGGQILFLTGDIHVAIGSRLYTFETTFPPYAAQITAKPFPSALPQQGELRSHETRRVVGAADFYTRIVSECPPNGSFKAYFSRFDFSLPKS